MGWSSVRYKTFKKSIKEYDIDAPSTYQGPIVDNSNMIDSLLLAITEFKKGDFEVYIAHGFLHTIEIGETNDVNSAIDLANGFMARHNTWAKVLNYLKRIHKVDLRTLKHSTC